MVIFYQHPDQDIIWLIKQPGATYTTHSGTDVLATLQWDETGRGDYSVWRFDSQGYLVSKDHYTGPLSAKYVTRSLTYSHTGTLTDWKDPTAPHYSNRESVETYETPTLSYGYDLVRAPDSLEQIKTPVAGYDTNVPTSAFSTQPVTDAELSEYREPQVWTPVVSPPGPVYSDDWLRRNYEIVVRTNINPAIPSWLYGRMKNTLYRLGYNLVSIQPYNDGYSIQVEEVGSVTLIVLLSIIGALLALLGIWIVTGSMNNLSNDRTQQATSNDVTSNIESALRTAEAMGLTKDETIELLNAVMNTYKEGITPPPVPPEPTSPWVWALILGAVALAASRSS